MSHAVDMRHRIALPSELGPAFSVRQAQALGVGQKRCASRDLARPFHGIRSVEAPETFDAMVAAYRPRMRGAQLISGMSALRLWRLPVPRSWRASDPLEVVVPLGAQPPRVRGVRGRRVLRDRVQSYRLDGIPAVDPISAVFLAAPRLSTDQLIVVLDALITDADNFPGRRPERPVITTATVERHLERWGRFPGCAQVRLALAQVREHVESAKETETRLAIIAAGLPEPVVQHRVPEHGLFIARVDLAYPQWKIAIEYEGDGHRTDMEQWRRDIQRQRDLEDHGWIVIRVTELDLREGGAALMRRIERAIASR